MDDNSNKFYSANYVVFDINSSDFSTSRINEFGKSVNAKDMVVLPPSVTNNNRYRCYCTRMNNGKFRLAKGEKSLAKKLKVEPKSLDIVPISDLKCLICFSNYWTLVNRLTTK